MTHDFKHDLTSKVKNWSAKRANQFHNNIPRVNPVKGSYIWLPEDNGFYYWGKDSVDFYRHDGMVFSVQRNCAENDWKCHSRLYEYSVESGEFRISEPVYRETIIINGEEWVYTEIRHPGDDIGYSAHFEGLIKDTYEYTRHWIDDITILIKYFHKLDKEFGCKYPSKVKMTNRLKDDQGFFWKDIKFWDKSFEWFFNKHLGEVQKAINRAAHNGQDIGWELADYAREQWTK